MHTIESEQFAGFEALRKGDSAKAREHLSRVVAAGRNDAAVLLALANACRRLDDQEGKIAAIDRLLSVEPRNTRALLGKADHLAALGDSRSAVSFYMAAIRSVPAANQVPADLAAELRRAQEMCQRYSAEYQSYIVAQLAAKGFDARTCSQRFAQSVDVILGRKKIYVQEPRYYYFPELPQIQFYERSLFPWLDKVEQATAAMRGELEEILKEPETFAPYVQGDPRRPRKDEAGMLNNPAWSAWYLWKNGEPVAGNAERCPKILAALEGAPLAKVPNRSPSILFSLLKPGAHIPPHNGLINTRLICHLPLIVPGPCDFRVGNDVRQWVEGKAWAFDDTIEHEAWNRTGATRVILLFDVWRPELSAEERALVVALFEAIDAYAGTKPEWSI